LAKDADLSALKADGLDLNPRFFVGHHRYNLFLTPSQATKLYRSGRARLGLIHDKIFSHGLSYDEAKIIHIEASDTFDRSAFPFHIAEVTPHDYTAAPENITEAVNLLSKCPEVLSIFLLRPPELFNRLGARYTQRNTKVLNSAGDFDRLFQAHNITGSDVVVAIIDTYLDTNSTFFYDSDHEIVNDSYTPEHRKVVYNFWHDDWVPEHSEHGTHTSGTIAGNATCGNCSMSTYNGIAPGSKLAFSGWPTDDEAVCFGLLLADLMDLVGSPINSNSWGWKGSYDDLNFLGDFFTVLNPDKLYIFSASNEGQYGYISVGTPAEAKNILSVGALSQLEVANVESLESRPYIVETLFFDAMFSWAYLLPGSAKPRWSTIYYTAAYNSMNYTSNLSRRFVYVHSLADVEFLAAKEASARPLAAFTNLTFECGNVSFPVLQVVSDEFWDYVTVSRYNNSQALVLCELYRPDSGEIELAYFSSIGPAFSGIMKPEVVAPGVHIISASSRPNSWPNYDVQDPPYVFAMDGTSMACPNVAGAAALVVEYLQKYHGIKPSSSFLKAILILSADPIDPTLGYGGYNPNLEFGFGQVNLANLPLDSSFQLLVGDEIQTDHESHLVATVTVSENPTHPLRVVVSYLDIPLDMEVPFPLVLELHLSVVSPNGIIYWGNQYMGGDDEHFTTTQHVFIPADELGPGDYQVHIISHLLEEGDSWNFSVAVSGDVVHRELDFKVVSHCVGSCGQGTCTARGLCECPPGEFVGDHCQYQVTRVVAGDDTKTLLIPPHGNAYVAFERFMTIFVDMNEGLWVHLFLTDGDPLAMPRDYIGLVFSNRH
jgi:subtilisin family serine protease